MTATSASYATPGDPSGNNGTVKIAEAGANTEMPENDPHINGCAVQVEWFDWEYVNGDLISTVTFEDIPPTADGGLQVTSGDLTHSVGGDAAGGAGNDPDGIEVYTLAFTGPPQAQQGYHVKLTVSTPDANDNNKSVTKTKTFWVGEECGPPDEECTPSTVTSWVTQPASTITETTTIPASTKTTTKTETTTETETATETVTETVPGQTVTTTAPGQTVTTTAPGQTVTETVTQPGSTVTTTAPGSTVTVTQPGQTVTQTIVNTITLPPVTETITAPGTTVTTTLPGETVTVTNTVTVAPSQASSPPQSTDTETTTVSVAPSDDTSVAGEQAQQAPANVPNAVAAGAEGPASPVPGGSKTLMFLALLVATLGAGLVGASVASKRQS